MQAISVKYFGPTNTRGSRMQATCQAGKVIVGYDHSLDIQGNADAAAKALIIKLGWNEYQGEWYSGQDKAGSWQYVKADNWSKLG